MAEAARVSQAASDIMDAQHDMYAAEWARADACAELIDACEGNTRVIREVCEAELTLKHSEVRSLASKALAWPSRTRDPLYSIAAHHEGMKRRNRSVS